MSKKFRNSILGFNRDDVMAFVLEAKDNEIKFKKTIDELNEKIGQLQASLDEMSLLQEQTAAILKETEKELNTYKEREGTLTKLSESIGRLYLVAQANANAVVASANDSAAESERIVQSNLEVACSAESKLAEISEVLNEKTKAYLSEINELEQDLAAVKERISANNADILERQATLDSVIAGANE